MIDNLLGRVLELSKKFKGRLEDECFEVLLSNINYDDWWLAFEMLCDFIADFDVSISTEEYDEIMRLAEDMKIDFSDRFSRRLKELVG